MENNNQSHLYLVTGLILGAALGLLISLVFAPTVHQVALPQELSSQAKAEYRLDIALAFLASPNLERAQSRLALLNDPDPVGALVAQAQELLASGGSENAARALVSLAAAQESASSPPTAQP
ncbi:MAG TPA: hypothetical protein PLH68_00825 [Anaerolineaceae bacterium]|jgi:Tfp pilus assembly protein PilF|nr:hypothetical protein [Anaerolineaceae bacterium]